MIGLHLTLYFIGYCQLGPSN